MLYLKQIRLDKHLSIASLSKLSSVPTRTIEDIEKRGDCRVSTLYLLAKALNVTLDDLFRNDESKTK